GDIRLPLAPGPCAWSTSLVRRCRGRRSHGREVVAPARGRGARRRLHPAAGPEGPSRPRGRPAGGPPPRWPPTARSCRLPDRGTVDGLVVLGARLVVGEVVRPLSRHLGEMEADQ